MANNKPLESAYQLPFEKAVNRLLHQINDLEADQGNNGRNFSTEIRHLRSQYISLLRNTYRQLSAWETVQVSRHPSRPLAGDYINMIVKDFSALHGDRLYGDDSALIGGMGRIGRERVMVIAQHKGRDTKEKITCNFGMMHPEGYRKAQRLASLAEKFHLPLVALIDTAGAYPGIGSEERGISEAIARTMQMMSRLKTPIVCVVIGEGGSGGAIGIGVGDRMAMMEFAWYSVISPEGCAAILWRDGAKAPEAAEALKLTANHLKKLDVIDDIITEPLGGAHRHPAEAAANLERHLVRTIRELKAIDIENLLDLRYKRWRRMGKFAEMPQPSTTKTQ